MDDPCATVNEPNRLTGSSGPRTTSLSCSRPQGSPNGHVARRPVSELDDRVFLLGTEVRQLTAQSGGVGAVDIYVDGFVARCDLLRGPGQSRVDRPGLHGVFSSDDPSATRLVVDDDHAIEVLPELLALTPGGMVNVLATAPRVADLLHRRERWRGRTATAMVTRDLRTTSGAVLPLDLTVRRVRRTDNDPPTDVPLVEAVVLAMRADPGDDSLATEALTAHLRAMPATVRLFAAVDRERAVLGTAGVGVFGHYAHVIFVNIDRTRRGEGIGRAMTARALTDARARGATAAYLDASVDGRRLYDAIGFETVAALTRFTNQL